METKLIELLKLCIEKSLNIAIDNHCKQVNVMLLNYETKEWLFYETTHFGIEAYGIKSMNNEHNERNLNELIEKVKNYKK